MRFSPFPNAIVHREWAKTQGASEFTTCGAGNPARTTCTPHEPALARTGLPLLRKQFSPLNPARHLHCRQQSQYASDRDRQAGKSIQKECPREQNQINQLRRSGLHQRRPEPDHHPQIAHHRATPIPANKSQMRCECRYGPPDTPATNGTRKTRPPERNSSSDEARSPAA